MQATKFKGELYKAISFCATKQKWRWCERDDDDNEQEEFKVKAVKRKKHRIFVNKSSTGIQF